MKTNTQKDNKGILGAVILIIVALVSLWDTTFMLDSDSYVFPRTIAIAMIGLCLLFIIWQILSPQTKQADEQQGVQGGSNLRRLSLVLVLLAGALLMPFIGFVLAGLGIFGALIFIAMYDHWTPARKIIYPLVGVGVVLLFYFLFAQILLVPLPVGALLDF